MRRKNIIKIIVFILLFYSCEPIHILYPEISSEFDREWVELNDIEVFDKLGNPTNFLRRSRASVVVIGDKVYIVGGSTGTSFLNDIWEFSLEDTTLRQKADFEGVPRANAIAFESDEKLYYGTGQFGGNPDDIASELWEFRPNDGNLGEWHQVEGVFFNSNQKRKEGVSFEINREIIVVGGRNQAGWNTNVVAFDLISKELKDKNSIGNQGVNGNPLRSFAVSFVLEVDGVKKGYFATGSICEGSPDSGDVWEYDFEADTWTRIKNGESQEVLLDRYDTRTRAVGFELDNKGIVCLGYARETIAIDGNNNSAPTTRALHDCWEYDPVDREWNQIDGLEDNTVESNFAVGFAVNGDGYILEGGFPSNLRIFKFRKK